ncbi:GDP-mannose 4,6-dehydratase [Planktomarina sp.]|nr:GDP-mannose 4,6-dehydratase [Planktomarina sp.]
MRRKIIITGSAGFIGFHLARILLEYGYEVVGIDNLNDYYDVNIKTARNKILKQDDNFEFLELDICDGFKSVLDKNLKNASAIVHLAAQAGVRNSIDFPQKYLESNINGSFSVLDLAKTLEIEHLLLASTSSVYGANTNMPFGEMANCNTPMSFYAASKISMEAMAHSYSHIYNIPTTIFRFFTVYGPWGRPDMALFKFTKSILSEEPIDVYNFGKMKRDFTYVEDLANCVKELIKCPPKLSQAIPIHACTSPVAPFRTVNIGNSQQVPLMDFIKVLENCLGKKAEINFLEMQQGDVEMTLADTDFLKSIIGFKPNTRIDMGIKNFVDWYLDYFSGRY